ncbi:MAG: hypothetical protein MN733_38375, partial [Nitrososphaera sp.]|nr:hypothetical protein [Nitrososphaera sp.]
ETSILRVLPNYPAAVNRSFHTNCGRTIIVRKMRLENEENLIALAQLVQALVIHNRILIEPNSYAFHFTGGLSHYVSDIGLASLIKPIYILDPMLNELRDLAEQRARGALAFLPDHVKEPLQRYAELKGPYAEGQHLIERQNSGDVPLETVAFRGYLYYGISYNLGLPYLPHPYRLPIIEHELQKRFMYKKAVDAAINAVTQTTTDILEQRNRQLGEKLFELKFSPILNFVLSKINNWRELIPRTLELRRSAEATAFRKLCTEIDKAAYEGNLDVLGEALDEIEARTRLWLDKSEPPKINVSIAIPLGIEFDLFDLGRYVQSKRKRYLIFLDRLYAASIKSTSIWHKIAHLNAVDI